MTLSTKILRSMLEIIAVCGLVLSSEASASTWSVSVNWARPGAYAWISIRLDADSTVASGVAVVDTSDWPYVELSEVDAITHRYRAVCEVAAGGLIVATLEGAELDPRYDAYCDVMVWISADAPSTTFPIGFASVSCLDEHSAPVSPCEGSPGSLFIDGPPTLIERSFLMLPHAPPRGPAVDVIDAFDPANAASTAPVESLDAPRPIRYWPRVQGPLGEPYLRPANDAAYSLLKAMYVTYGSLEDREQALAAARVDPQVAAVFPDAEMPHLYLYPERPRAHAPLALYLETGICEPYRTDHPDDREVDVIGNTVVVYLSTDNDNICGVPPPGTFPHFINLPSLPAGEYHLRVTSRPYYPGHEVKDRYTLDFSVAGGAEPIAEPLVVPALADTGLIALFVLVTAIAVIRSRRH